ncbi:MAG: DUF1365 domain-containing protein [Pseudomonadota bacterium]|nr:DUF1365 domain-containing protein [Pseudomonadota bacterium]
MRSAIYHGSLRHRRFAPREHSFTYGLFLVYLDLAELDTVFRHRWLWSTRRRAVASFRRSDHFGDPALPLDQCVRDLVAQETGSRPAGPIRLLTHLRYFGCCFNPVSFYYCFDETGEKVETIVAEVTNTPWRERHCYVLAGAPESQSDRYLRYGTRKGMHVSPFMPMDLEYSWGFTPPGERLNVHMALTSAHKVFDATLRLERAPVNARVLARVLVAYPLMTLKVIAGIHWEALRLWLKGVPVQTHPDKINPRPSAANVEKA